MALASLAAMLLLLGMVLAFTGPASAFGLQTGEGASYPIIPYSPMLAPVAALVVS